MVLSCDLTQRGKHFIEAAIDRRPAEQQRISHQCIGGLQRFQPAHSGGVGPEMSRVGLLPAGVRCNAIAFRPTRPAPAVGCNRLARLEPYSYAPRHGAEGSLRFLPRRPVVLSFDLTQRREQPSLIDAPPKRNMYRVNGLVASNVSNQLTLVESPSVSSSIVRRATTTPKSIS